MCDKAFDDFLPTLKFVPDWFVTKKWIYLFADDNILFFDEYSGNVTLTTDEMSILCVNLNKFHPDDCNFYENAPKTIIHVSIFGWHKAT